MYTTLSEVFGKNFKKELNCNVVESNDTFISLKLKVFEDKIDISYIDTLILKLENNTLQAKHVHFSASLECDNGDIGSVSYNESEETFNLNDEKVVDLLKHLITYPLSEFCSHNSKTKDISIHDFSEFEM